jgi:hypothetical protein
VTPTPQNAPSRRGIGEPRDPLKPTWPNRKEPLRYV